MFYIRQKAIWFRVSGFRFNVSLYHFALCQNYFTDYVCNINKKIVLLYPFFILPVAVSMALAYFCPYHFLIRCRRTPFCLLFLSAGKELALYTGKIAPPFFFSVVYSVVIRLLFVFFSSLTDRFRLWYIACNYIFVNFCEDARP